MSDRVGFVYFSKETPVDNSLVVSTSNARYFEDSSGNVVWLFHTVVAYRLVQL